MDDIPGAAGTVRGAPEAFCGWQQLQLVHGEADFLPGLVVDRFGGVLVVQLLTLGMDSRRETIVRALADVFEPAGIYERSDVPVRTLEGLEERTGPLYGDCPAVVEIEENGLLEVDIAKGQKTGYFSTSARTALPSRRS